MELKDIVRIVVTSVINIGIGSLVTYLICVLKVFKTIKSSQCSQLRMQILDLSHKCTAKEYITYEELDALTHAYEDYHQLGGNGTITKIYEEVSSLPLRNK